jgi:PadR family transcriptional regulator, regulatory protein AphA
MSYALLGMVALRGPSTPYQLERAVRRSIGHFWQVPRSHFYSAPERLAEQGLLAEQREETGRRRRIYTITERGRLAVEEWLNEPTSTPMEVRDEGALKLFLGELASPEAVAALAHAQEEAHRRKVNELVAIASQAVDGDDRTTRMAPLGLGLRVMQAGADYWRDIASQPPHRPRPRGADAGRAGRGAENDNQPETEGRR